MKKGPVVISRIPLLFTKPPTLKISFIILSFAEIVIIFDLKNLKNLGLFNIDGVDYLEGVSKPQGAYCRFSELSQGKDTTVGHWELAGVVSPELFPTYPEGFPPEVIDEFVRQTGRGVLCNKPYSGTDVIRDFGEEHLYEFMYFEGTLCTYVDGDLLFSRTAGSYDFIFTELFGCSYGGSNPNFNAKGEVDFLRFAVLPAAN